ncbi:hypothetical protein PGB90_005272 [Kerria lacca]
MFTKKFKQAFIDENNKIIFREKDLPTELNKFHVLVKVLACGISASTKYNKMVYDEIKYDIPHASFRTDIAGIVQNVGTEVKTLQIGDQVTGVLLLSCKQFECSEYVIIEEYDLVRISQFVSITDAAACIGDGFRSYVALFYCSKITEDDVVLVLNGASPSAVLCIQLAHNVGAKVITTCMSSTEKMYLETFNNCIDEIIDLFHTENVANTLFSECMKKTDYLGVDVIFDLEEQNKNVYVNDHFGIEDIISCLTIHGRWVTCNSWLQLDPPDCNRLFERCACVSFLCEEAWLMSKMFQGKYQHILQNVMKKLKDGVIRPCKYEIFNFESLPEKMHDILKEKFKIVIIMQQ